MNNIITEEWKQARQQADKLLEVYEDIIKPTLLEFYSLTGEDFNIKIDRDTNNIETTISFDRGQNIEYQDIIYTDKYSTTPTDSQHQYTYLDTDDEFIKQPNIKVIKVFSKHWNNIVAYMDDRIKSMYNNLKD